MYFLMVPLILWLFYKWSVNTFDYFEKIGVPYEKPFPLVGNNFGMITRTKSWVDETRNSYNNFKESKIFGFFNFKQPYFIVTDPELIKKITVKDFDHFVNHHFPPIKADKFFSRTLFGLFNKEWRDMRSALSPIFTSSKMKMMFGLLSNQARDFVNFFEGKAKEGEILILDAKDVFSRFTADGISTSAFGFEADCVRNKDSYVFKMANKVFDDWFGVTGTLKIILSNVFPKLYEISNLQLTSQEMVKFFKRVVVDTMNERDRKNISRPDVIQLMLQLKKGQLQNDKENDVNDKELANYSVDTDVDVSSKNQNSTQFSEEDWISQGLIFFLAGFDTTASLITMTSYELARNPDIQRKLFKEIDSVTSSLDGSLISYEQLHKMKFLDMVISEGLRKWSPSLQSDRVCVKDYNVVLGNGKTITIKKDQNIVIPNYHLHHDERFFPNPEKFDPYRFSDENKESIVQGSYLPFGMGPRTCIGNRFALMEGKLLLFSLLSKFSIEKCDETPETITYDVSVGPVIKETVYLKFVLRK